MNSLRGRCPASKPKKAIHATYHITQSSQLHGKVSTDANGSEAVFSESHAIRYMQSAERLLKSTPICGRRKAAAVPKTADEKYNRQIAVGQNFKSIDQSNRCRGTHRSYHLVDSKH
jgi:hypothetical protein